MPTIDAPAYVKSAHGRQFPADDYCKVIVFTPRTLRNSSNGKS